MARHRDDEDFGNLDAYPVFKALEETPILQLKLCPARLVVHSVDVDLSDLDFTPPDSSRVKTRPLPEEELTNNLEAAFGHVHIRARSNGETSINIVDEVALDNLMSSFQERGKQR